MAAPCQLLGKSGQQPGEELCFWHNLRVLGHGEGVKSPPASRNPPGTGDGARIC